ncbi:ATP-binding protein [Amaricoccus macauensis]|uniref:ATP-binding protein n=1 Tax=Amaricoccus macauensis TaxID=57001 RepID=UPI003C7B0C67
MKPPAAPLAHPLRWIALAAAGLVLTGGIWAGSNALERRFQNDLVERGEAGLALYSEMTRGWLARSRMLPPIYARSPVVLAALQFPANETMLAKLNSDLEMWNATSGSAVTYVLDREGTTIASSNWADPDSFVGSNFAFRPYFREAMQGQLGRFFGLGTTSGQRGQYFAAPVRAPDLSIIGAIVTKTDVTGLEQDLRLSRAEIFVSDSAGVVILAGNPAFRLTSLGDLAPDEARRISAERQFDMEVIGPAPLRAATRGSWPPGSAAVLATADRGGAPEVEFLHLTQDMATEGWTLHLLLDTAPVRAKLWFSALTTLAILVALAAIAAIYVQRRARLLERLRERDRAERLLSRKVEERTADLAAAVTRLRTEVAERKAAEADLRQTQAELVQAGKLAALGQMSAALSHEFNQPLTAIRSYSENAIAFVEAQRGDRAQENLRRVLRLTDRMGQLSKHLERFARRSQEGLEPVELETVFAETLALLEGRIRRADANVRIEGDTSITVMGGQVRLQHVFMNLIGNAIDAASPAAPEITFRLARIGDWIEITVEDDGPGIPEEVLPNVFEPFFTTKEVGSGLGLGLSISFNIIRDFGGTIRAMNRDDGGARFVIRLRAADAGEREAAE